MQPGLCQHFQPPTIREMSAAFQPFKNSERWKLLCVWRIASRLGTLDKDQEKIPLVELIEDCCKPVFLAFLTLTFLNGWWGKLGYCMRGKHMGGPGPSNCNTSSGRNGVLGVILWLTTSRLVEFQGFQIYWQASHTGTPALPPKAKGSRKGMYISTSVARARGG